MYVYEYVCGYDWVSVSTHGPRDRSLYNCVVFFISNKDEGLLVQYTVLEICKSLLSLLR